MHIPGMRYTVFILFLFSFTIFGLYLVSLSFFLYVDTLQSKIFLSLFLCMYLFSFHCFSHDQRTPPSTTTGRIHCQSRDIENEKAFERIVPRQKKRNTNTNTNTNTSTM